MAEDITPDTHTPPTVRLFTPDDANSAMDVSNREDDVVNVVSCVKSPLPREDVQVLLARKKGLQVKLLKADHHRAFLGICLKAKVIPKATRDG